MKIDKITFKNEQAWIVIKSENGNYLGTWHIVNRDFVEAIRKEIPKSIFFPTSAKADPSGSLIDVKEENQK